MTRPLWVRLWAIVMAGVLSFALVARAAAADAVETTTTEIFQATLDAVPSCIQWKPKGVCIWLVCVLYSCSVEETLRIEHYTPDVTISTFHDPATHPWKDYGRVIAQKMDAPGKSLLNAFGGALGGTGASSVVQLDSGGTKTKADHDTKNYIYRGVDAIGNPANFVQGAITGNYGSGKSPTYVTIPTPIELWNFFGSAYSQVSDQWATVGSSYTSGQSDYARQKTGEWGSLVGMSGSSAGLAGKVVGAYQNVMGAYTQASGAMKIADQQGGGNGDNNGQGSTGGTGASSGSASGGSSSGSGSGSGGNGDNGNSGGGSAGTATGGSEYMCPPGITPFGLAFQSDLDTPFWRGLLPLESIFPATWLPGMREVGQGIFQTWGNVWPRQGALFQQHPVKGAAVIAQRAGDIISYKAQPHIYAPLQLDTDDNYKFFGFQGIKEHDKEHTVWQRVFPHPQKQCSIFGEDDSTSLTSFGDGHNLNEHGTVWNAWRRQDCCKKPSDGVAVFLFSVP